jgi:hypothetical protein
LTSPIWTVVFPDDETIWAWCGPANDWISLYCQGPLDDLERTTFCDDDGNPLPDQAKARAEYVARPHGEDPVKTETMGPWIWIEETLQTQFLDIYGPGVKSQCESWDDSKLTSYHDLRAGWLAELAQSTDESWKTMAADLTDRDCDLEATEELKRVSDYIAKTKDMTREEYEHFAIQEHTGYLEKKQAFFAGMEKRRMFIESIPDVTKEDDAAFSQELLDQGTED